MVSDLRERLTFNVVDGDTLPCREKECQAIAKFIEQNLRAEMSGTMYISGMPGTGKTASVNQTIKRLSSGKLSKSLPKFQYISINGMHVGYPKMLFVAFYQQLTKTKRRISSNSAFIYLQKYFEKDVCDDEKIPTILLVDELDVLVTKKQKILYRLFDWSTQDCAKLTVLAIANTLDLPERMLSHRICSRLGLNRLCFQPYTHTQIEEILKSRLKNCSSVQPDALQYIARKVAAVSGDVRRALEICRSAAEIFYKELKKNKKCKFGLQHATKALQTVEGGAKVTFVKVSAEHEKLLLKSGLAEYNRVGSEEFTVCRLLSHYRDFAEESDTNCTTEEIMQIFHKLCESRIFVAGPGRQNFTRKVRLNINPDDLNFALTGR